MLNSIFEPNVQSIISYDVSDNGYNDVYDSRYAYDEIYTLCSGTECYTTEEEILLKIEKEVVPSRIEYYAENNYVKESDLVYRFKKLYYKRNESIGYALEIMESKYLGAEYGDQWGIESSQYAIISFKEAVNTFHEI